MADYTFWKILESFLYERRKNAAFHQLLLICTHALHVELMLKFLTCRAEATLADTIQLFQKQ